VFPKLVLLLFVRLPPAEGDRFPLNAPSGTGGLDSLTEYEETIDEHRK